jgi:hypothetical protein
MATTSRCCIGRSSPSAQSRTDGTLTACSTHFSSAHSSSRLPRGLQYSCRACCPLLPIERRRSCLIPATRTSRLALCTCRQVETPSHSFVANASSLSLSLLQKHYASILIITRASIALAPKHGLQQQQSILGLRRKPLRRWRQPLRQRGIWSGKPLRTVVW